MGKIDKGSEPGVASEETQKSFQGWKGGKRGVSSFDDQDV